MEVKCHGKIVHYCWMYIVHTIYLCKNVHNNYNNSEHLQQNKLKKDLEWATQKFN